MVESGEPVAKKQKLSFNVFESFIKENSSEVEQLRLAILAIEQGLSRCVVRSRKVIAADANYPSSFRNAKICFDDSELNLYPFGLLFKKSLSMIRSFLQSDGVKLPEDEEQKKALELLLKYLINLEKESKLLKSNPTSNDKEWNWTLKLAQHVFSKLSLNPHYLYDISITYNAENGCPCVEHDALNGSKGDTSFGLDLGWHGKTDILMGDVPVIRPVDDTDDCAEVASTSSNVSVTDSDFSMGFEVKTSVYFSHSEYLQIFAETITFSFLKNKVKTESSLVPLIAVNKDYIQIHFYDSEKDILLESGPVLLTVGSEDDNLVLNHIAVIMIWLTLNYRMFPLNATESMKKSGFHQMINLEKYKTQVKSPCHVKSSTFRKWTHESKWAESCKFVKERGNVINEGSSEETK